MQTLNGNNPDSNVLHPSRGNTNNPIPPPSDPIQLTDHPPIPSRRTPKRTHPSPTPTQIPIHVPQRNTQNGALSTPSPMEKSTVKATQLISIPSASITAVGSYRNSVFVSVYGDRLFVYTLKSGTELKDPASF